MPHTCLHDEIARQRIADAHHLADDARRAPSGSRVTVPFRHAVRSTVARSRLARRPLPSDFRRLEAGRPTSADF
jgi:hypothetical protein